jgi:hypothetical protein
VRRLRGWHALVAASGTLIGLLVLVTGVGWVASLHARSVSYAITAPLSRVDLELASGNADIVASSSPALQVRRTENYAFGHAARERRWVTAGVLHITSACPRIVLGSCSASYELAVPQGVTVQVRTDAGAVRMNGFSGDATVATHSGNVDIEAYCGFHLSALSQSGSLSVATACAPQSLRLQTGSGDAQALVPPGRYRIVAVSGGRRQRVTGVRNDPTAPFTITVESGSGSVAVEGGL